MTIKEYVKDNLLVLSSSIFCYVISLWLMIGFQVSFLCIFLISFICLCILMFCVMYTYFQKRKFYQYLLFHLQELDKKYLLSELITPPNFYEGQVLCQTLYETNKNMNEHIKTYERRLRFFQEYIEMWIHEIKIPIASGFLLLHNRPIEERKMQEILRQMENYVEQILYYARGENPEKDYYIHKINLKNVINQVAIRNQDSFIYKKIKLEIIGEGAFVWTDAKWLEFIVGQIVQNSIQYCDKENSIIRIESNHSNECINLTVSDNGMGIESNELPRVFDKSFTGTNGRKIRSSTGMGLFITKNLCEKLGHQITIDSTIGVGTSVTITFHTTDYYSVLEQGKYY